MGQAPIGLGVNPDLQQLAERQRQAKWVRDRRFVIASYPVPPTEDGTPQAPVAALRFVLPTRTGEVEEKSMVLANGQPLQSASPQLLYEWALENGLKPYQGTGQLEMPESTLGQPASSTEPSGEQATSIEIARR
jgi:hypothetical protein